MKNHIKYDMQIEWTLMFCIKDLIIFQTDLAFHTFVSSVHFVDSLEAFY